MSAALQVDYQEALDAIDKLLDTAAAEGKIIEASFTPVFVGDRMVARQINGLRIVEVPGHPV